ncbi:MAG: hypothetical protein KDC73_11045 [Ignavibacteriae bacterium]|nr:hypothetical protein [Ignavibacteriota bacterium]MCB0725226.1 hypothetical protein [Ignavibacteriota bacterium]MCB9242450.1 hypothetical protein [Ignavibacteriales bacterium]
MSSKIFRNGVDLGDKLLDFVANAKLLTIFSPYIKLNSLESLIENSKSVNIVVVRWEPLDLIMGVSDLEIYPYLNKKGIYLYRNPRLHLKAFIDNGKRCFMGSANISSRALNIPNSNNYNYELGTIVENISIDEQLYFNKLINNSILITDVVYEQFKEQIENSQAIKPQIDIDFELVAPDRNFLISSLPMSYNTEKLLDVYYKRSEYSEIDFNCALHDLALYDVNLDLEKEDLMLSVKKAFFNHPFINGFLENIDENGEIYFGRAKDWIHKNCTTVPTPRKWEITDNIQILYRWIVELSDGVYNVDKPHHSERLYKVKNYVK